MPQTLSDIKSLLAARGLHPRKRFGQNFLIDPRKLEQIVEAAGVGGGNLVLEVGPGTGVLTERLIEAGATVIACEIDRDMCDILRERLGDHDLFTLIEGDVMAGKHDLAPDVASCLRASVPSCLPNFSLIANLPYNIASPLLATLALDWPTMQRAVVMIQKEVGDRIISPPGVKAYGPLSIVMQLAFEIERIATLPPGCFWPAPQIDSVVLRCERRAAPLVDDMQGVVDLAQRLFQQRRKQIGSTLGRDIAYPPGIDPTMRPEQLTVAQFITLAGNAD
jgi:16S rRNA (adenine1518-N6/adenine1519-N6)-dimethyltransferase